MPRKLNVSIGPEPFESEDARGLLLAQEAELAGVYPPGERFLTVDPAVFEEARARFLVARADGRAVGCGAVIRRDEHTGEVKRMYVAPALRRQGVASAILGQLEAWAAQTGLRRLVLETGERHAGPVDLYRGAGYVAIPRFGEYLTSQSSRCFEKTLVPNAEGAR